MLASLLLFGITQGSLRDSDYLESIHLNQVGVLYQVERFTCYEVSIDLVDVFQQIETLNVTGINSLKTLHRAQKLYGTSDSHLHTKISVNQDHLMFHGRKIFSDCYKLCKSLDGRLPQIEDLKNFPHEKAQGFLDSYYSNESKVASRLGS